MASAATRRTSTSTRNAYTEVDNHLTRLHELSRRHRLPVAELHDKLAGLRTELAELEGAGDALEQLAARAPAAASTITPAQRRRLSAARATAAIRLGDEVSALMAELGMAGGVLRVELEAG